MPLPHAHRPARRPPRRSPRVTAVPALAASAALLLGATACGVSSDDTGASSTQKTGTSSSTPSASPSESPTASPTDSDTTGTGSDGASDGAGSGGDLGTAVTTRSADDDGFALTLTVYPVTRDGDLAVLNFTVAAKADDPRSQWQVASSFGDGNFQASDFSGDSVDGVKLTDGEHKQLHLVASDGRGNCLCSRGLSSTFIRAGSSKTFTATYAAPPADVDEVALSFPLFGTVTGVPVG